MNMLWETEAKKFGADLDRVQVWDALSEFYLDTSLDKEDLERIAQILARSPFSLEELRHIELSEVEPVCASNLSLLPGEWAGFTPDWLIPKCLERQRKTPYQPDSRPPWFYRFLRATWPSNVPRQRIAEIRKTQNSST
jgi:hypothetical protein